MKLRVLKRAEYNRVVREVGAALVLPDDEAQQLLRIAPDVYAVEPEPEPEPETAALDAPPADKMMRRRSVKRG
jgi:hypothetical protein